MNINQLTNELRIKINNETHTPQEWNMIAKQLANLAQLSHNRIPDCHELERVDEKK